VQEDGGAGTAVPCECRHDDLVPRLLARAGIPSRYARCTLSNFKTDLGDSVEREQLFRALRVSGQYVDGFLTESGRYAESGLLYIGRPGVGKTHLAVAVLGELIRRYRVHGMFVDFTSLIHRIQSTFDPQTADTKHGILREVTDAEVLILDELGAQKPSPWVTEILYLVMNDRYSRRLPTIFTTNYRLDPAEQKARGLDRGSDPVDEELLSRRIPARLLSRLYEMALPIAIEASDFRREIKMRRQPV
jgi:DNA replication protein DnaC